MTKNLKMLMTKLWNQAHKENRRRDRAKKAYTSPKPSSKEEKLARLEKANSNRAKIKAYHLVKDELEARELNAIMRFNVIVSKKFPAEFRLRDIKARERELKAIALWGKVEVKPTSSSKCTPRFYKTKRVEALKVLRESNLKAVA
jgi:hypothetical protein